MVTTGALGMGAFALPISITPAAVAVMIERYTRPDAEPPGR